MLPLADMGSERNKENGVLKVLNIYLANQECANFDENFLCRIFGGEPHYGEPFALGAGGSLATGQSHYVWRAEIRLEDYSTNLPGMF